MGEIMAQRDKTSTASRIDERPEQQSHDAIHEEKVEGSNSRPPRSLKMARKPQPRVGSSRGGHATIPFCMLFWPLGLCSRSSPHPDSNGGTRQPWGRCVGQQRIPPARIWSAKWVGNAGAVMENRMASRDVDEGRMTGARDVSIESGQGLPRLPIPRRAGPQTSGNEHSHLQTLLSAQRGTTTEQPTA
ncbi:hypothetical protein CC78DRAFT_547797 [Lojkania enalia]|uniref:Uncharacterized protein n=1 Tax=Lojkania enalia TaxID=147567 RepID=A0A9P4N5Z3_9PLEO|nr:hypothetical protein CC78DRAFT_547797 [Didymosphaeria enalia]